MCIIIVANGSKIPTSHIRECIKSNPDGTGLAYVSDGHIIVRKGLWTEAQAINHIRLAEKAAGESLIVHMRIATHGLVCNELCHPFRVNDSLVMFHNGILSDFSPLTTDRSDSWEFADYLAQLIREGINIQSEAFTALMERYVLGGNKIALLDSSGERIIYNRRYGQIIDGRWYSNNSWMPSFKTTKTLKQYKAKKRHASVKRLYDYTEVARCDSCNEVSEIFYIDGIQSNLCHDCVDYWMHIGELDYDDLKYSPLYDEFEFSEDEDE